ncbi:MAG: helix-turn-helix domain-containing protein [Victivallales bacterium]|nr:helix-turn-helix domain-containing protein [Victivallales bacterium]
MKTLQNIDKHIALKEFDRALTGFEESLGLNITLHDYTGVLYHLDEKRLFPNRNYHQCPYCMAGRFQEPGWRLLCVKDCLKESDSRLLKDPKPYLKNCWKGVIELVIPLISQKKIIAAAYVGAFKGEISETSSIPEKYLALHKLLPELPQMDEIIHIQTMVTIFIQGLLSTIHFIMDNEQKIEYGRKIVISRFIQENASGNLRLVDLARHLCLSPSRTVHLVRTTFKKTFSSLVLEERMIQARALLENDWLTLEEIAERSGFKNVHYFNTVFKKNYGVPPGQYRKQLKDKTT